MQKHIPLLRRPLPPKLPKLPKLPVPKKKACTAKIVKTVPQDVEVAQDKTISIKEDTGIASRPQPLTAVKVQTISLDPHIEEKVTHVTPLLPAPKNDPQVASVHSPGTVHSDAYFRSHPASAQSSVREISQTESLRKSETQLFKLKKRYIDEKLEDILILSSNFSKLSSVHESPATGKTEDVPTKSALKSVDSPFVSPMVALSTEVLSPLPSVIYPKPERKWNDNRRQNSPAILNINDLPGPLNIPKGVLRRKPQKQPTIEATIREDEDEETPRLKVSNVPHGLIKTKRKKELEGDVIHGEGFNTVLATEYETIMAMTNLAILHCQLHGRNALNLKGFFILNCPDLSALAYQLIYLNLSFNDIHKFPTEVFCLKNLQVLILRNNPIREIPSEIQKLKHLRVFNMAFNLITFLPPGLFSLSYLEELDVSYNDITYIQNEIQKLRSLEKLNVDGNELTSFPSGLLKLNLRKIHFENNYTHPCLWRESTWNNAQRLTHMAALVFVKNNLFKYYEMIPEKIQKSLKWTSCCEWCRGPMFGEGLRVIRSCDVFGATQVPVLFHVCSPVCYGHVKQSN